MAKKRGWSDAKLRPVERAVLRKLRAARLEFPGRVNGKDVGKLWVHRTADKYD